MICVNDLSVCRPKSALSTTRQEGHWRLLPYEADGISGTMLAAEELTGAPNVTLPLNVKGWHAIHVGFWNPRMHWTKDTIIKLKLSTDTCFRRIRHKAPDPCWTGMELHEAFWDYADLTGRDLVIGQHSKGFPANAHIAYVKLEPLPPERVEEIREDRARTDTRTLISLNDGTSFLNGEACTTEEELLEQVELYRHSDVGTVFWAVCYGDRTNYPSEVGMMIGTDAQHSGSQGRANVTGSLRALISQGLIPFQVIMRRVHEMGLQFHTQFRLGILSGDHMGGGRTGSFSSKHPEFRIVHRDGTPLPKMSYAFPQVRQFMVSLIREVGQQDIDGVNLCFIRGPMFVGHEKPVVDDFKRKHGRDPREIDENDARWLTHKAEYVTEFLRQVRRLVDEIGTSRGRKLQLSAMTYWSEPLNMYHGFDMRTWVQEGLLDFIIGGLRDKDFVRSVKGSNCKLVTSSGERTPANYVRAAQLCREAGADGVSVWDMNGPQDHPEHWEVLRSLGHSERVEAFARQLPKLKTFKLKTLGGVDVCHLCNKDAPDGWPPEMLTLVTCG